MTQTAETARMLAWAENFAAGDCRDLLYTPAEYAGALQSFHDGGDSDDLAYMVGREFAMDRFCDWQYFPWDDREAERREFTDFEDWLEMQGRAPESYIPAVAL